MVQSGILRDNALILVGDLNLTVSPKEVWGGGNNVDLLSDYYFSLFENTSLIDIVLNVLVPTWSNGRCGVACNVKRLDKYLMAEDLSE